MAANRFDRKSDRKEEKRFIAWFFNPQNLSRASTVTPSRLIFLYKKE